MQDQTSASYYQAMMAGQPQFPEQEQLKCPRCYSTNTKFCYYNNYNLSQPRHFCKSCRRYWTKGGVLRNIPVGGGSRKNTKRSKKNQVVRDPDLNSGSGSSRISCQDQDPTRVIFGSPAVDHQGVKDVDLGESFSSVLTSNLQLRGIVLDGFVENGSGWDPGLGSRRSDSATSGGAWTGLARNSGDELKG